MAFARVGVDYLIVDHHAVLLHSHQLWASALKLWISPTAANFKKVAAALTQLRTPLTATELLHLPKPRAKLRLHSYCAELRTSMHGLEDFVGALQRADIVYVKGQGHPTLCESDLHRIKNTI